MAVPPSETASAWRELSAGRMAVLDFYERAGRRYLVLSRAAHRPLVTERQRLVIGYRAYCQTLATIAAELDVSVPTIANELSAGLRRLGLEVDTELPKVFGVGLKLLPAGGKGPAPRLSMSRLRSEVRNAPFSVPRGLRAERTAHRGKPALRVSFPVPKNDWAESLTSAEKDVAQDILAGLPNGAIGRKRGSSVRTVVNQVASIFKKLGAHSRLELCLVAYAGRTPPAAASRRRRTRTRAGSPRRRRRS